MSDLARKLEAAREHVTVEWTAERARRVEQAIAARQNGARFSDRPRRSATRVWAAAAAAVALATVSIAAMAGALTLARGWERPVPQTPVTPVEIRGPAVKAHGTPVFSGAEPPVDPLPSPSTMAAPLAVAAAASAIPSGSRWRKEADDGDFDGAFRTLKAAGMASSVKDEPGDLLLAADVARLSGHAEAALAPLKQLVRQHRADPRAALAAFTLGRVLLDELGRPAEAAAAFNDARSLGAGGPLEEDALAREVEAAARAGETDRARTLAEEYLGRYPDGRRSRAVRKFGAIE